MTTQPLAQASVAHWAAARVPSTEIDALRARLAAIDGGVLFPRFLKNSDHQTLVGVNAMVQAIHSSNIDARSFQDWAVLGAPQFMGRLTVAGMIDRFLADPAFSVSPHVIPNQCLHSLSGTISVAMGIRGPNYGVGGGPGAVAEVLLAGLTLIRDGRAPGVWTVMTACRPEPIPDAGGKASRPFDIDAVALALTATDARGSTLSLHDRTDARHADSPLHSLCEYLEGPRPDGPWRCHVAGLGRLELLL